MNWTKPEIVAILKNPTGNTGTVANRTIVYKMLQAMYRRQTADERAVGVTKHDNSVGFNGLDSPFLSSVAQSSQKYKSLSPKQLAPVAKMLIKYAGQLEEIAMEKRQPVLPTTTEPVTPAPCRECDNATAEEGGLCFNCRWIALKNEAAAAERAREEAAYMSDAEMYLNRV